VTRMKSTWLWGTLTVALIAGCGGDRRNTDTGTAGGTGTETGTMQNEAGTSYTAIPSRGTGANTGTMNSDTAHADAGMHGDMHQQGAGASDSAKANQTKSGVTNTETGKSTLGKGVTRTRPDQGQPVTSKGDTVSAGADTTAANQ
jgi:hypothetical protein